MDYWLRNALGKVATILDNEDPFPGEPNNEQAFCTALGRAIQGQLRDNPNAVLHQQPVGMKRIDLWIKPFQVAIEVKYQREIPSGWNRPMTQQFGQLLADFSKVALVDAAERYVILATDTAGTTYLLNRPEILPVSAGKSRELDEGRIQALPSTAIRQALIDEWTDCEVKLALERRLTSGRLFVWEVVPVRT